jgi:acyl-CoA thioesterase-1
VSHDKNAYVIVCFGDSYTEGLGVTSKEAYPALLQKALPETKVINAGVSGETAGEALERIFGDVLSKNPSLVIVEFGTNEAFRSLPMEESLKNIEKIVERTQALGANVILVGTRFGDYQENFDQSLRGIAQRNEAGLVLNVLEGVLDNPALKSDAYHPNAEGYRIMAERILPEVQKFVKSKKENAAI